MSSSLFCATGCDTKEVQSIAALTAPVLAQVGGDRGRGTPNLLGQIKISPLNGPNHIAQTFDDLERPFQRDELRSSVSIHFGGHAPFGAEGVTTRMHWPRHRRPRVGATCAPLPA
jgi:hypothetical protein